MHRNYSKKKIVIAIFFSLLMIVPMVFMADNFVSQQPNITIMGNSTHSGKNQILVNASSSSHTPWTFPTKTSEEPGYTGGTYITALAGPPGDLNPFTANTAIDGTVYGDVYMGLYQTLLNASIAPSLASGYTLTKISPTSNHTTFDIEKDKYVNYSAIYTVDLRSHVLWTDWTQANATQTYTFSNVTNFNNDTGVNIPHTYKTYKTMKMLKYDLQAGDVVCSWRIGEAYKDYPGVVNVVPVNNLTVDFYVTAPNLLIVQSDFQDIVVPYNVWHKHNFSSESGYFNYQPSFTSAQDANAYNKWNMGWNLITGTVSGLVGNGPFMVSNSLGMPQGKVIPNHVIIEYANPYFFYQYTNANSGLRQFTPKINAYEWKEYVSVASMELALDQGKFDSLGGIAVSNIPQYLSVPNTEVLSGPAVGYNMLDFNVHNQVSPLNCTNFRVALNYAIPKSYIAADICHGTIPGQTWMVPANIAFFNSSTPSYPFNLAKARSILNDTKGFSYVNGKLDYYGKPVAITVDILSAAIAAPIDLAMYVIKGDWESIGVTVSLSLVSVGTMFGDLSAVQDGASNTSFEIENFCDSNGVGDSAQCCAVRYNPHYGLAACAYAGPFSPITYDGKHLSGNQVQSLMNNLTVKALHTNNIVTAEKLVKEMQGIEVTESIVIPLGYVPGHIPILLTYFKNQSKMGEGFSYWNALSVEKRTTPLSVPKVTSLNVTDSITQDAFSSGQYGNITIAVTKNGNPVSDVNITVGISAPFSGVLNVSSTNLVTNSHGVAIFEFRTTSSLKNLLSLGDASYEMVNFTIVANQMNTKVSPAVVEAANTSHLSVVASAFSVTPTKVPTEKVTSVLSYEIGIIVASVVAALAVIGLVYTRMSVKKK